MKHVGWFGENFICHLAMQHMLNNEASDIRLIAYFKSSLHPDINVQNLHLHVIKNYNTSLKVDLIN